MNKSKQFSDDNNITGVKLIDQDYHQFNKKNLRNETPFG